MLALMRHAKSARPPGVADIDRPLATRGEDDAALVGNFLATAFPAPAAVVTSPARRARDTAALVAAAAGWRVAATVDERLYYGGVDDLLAAVSGAPQPVIAFGHEPTWSAAVSALVGGGRIPMVTAAVAGIDISRPAHGRGSLIWLVTPALLGGGKQ